jgi:hypothetical protein
MHYVTKPNYDRHDITEILLKVALNTIKPTKPNNENKIPLACSIFDY